MMIIPTHVFQILLLLLLSCASAYPKTYYVDSNSGADTNDGLSQFKPWKSLAKVNTTVFAPGDKILLATGSRFTGQLAPTGGDGIHNGKPLPIIVASYGKGNRPLIEGEGKVPATVFLHNLEGWEIHDLEITNKGPKRARQRYGVHVLNEKHDTARHIVLKNLHVHDVNGALRKEKAAGAGILVAIGQGMRKRFDRVLIEGCHVKNCERNGIMIHGGKLRPDWFPSTNVIIRRNLIEGVGGDGIVPAMCDGALVEWNVMRACPRYGEEMGAAAGIWPWSSDNTILQFNEVSDHKAWVDGQAYDCDFNCNGTIYQYNYSHNNEGGFMLICSPGVQKTGMFVGNEMNKGSIVRYNLSINDGSRTTEGKKHYNSPTFDITGETTQNTEIHGNVIIIPPKKDPKMDTNIFDFGNWGGKYPVHTLIRDNIFWAQNGQKGTFEFGQAKQVRFERNLFLGAIEPITEAKEIQINANEYQTTPIPRVTLKGDRKSLETFQKFLKTKGDPHLKAGLTIDWNASHKN